MLLLNTKLGTSGNGGLSAQVGARDMVHSKAENPPTCCFIDPLYTGETSHSYQQPSFLAGEPSQLLRLLLHMV